MARCDVEEPIGGGVIAEGGELRYDLFLAHADADLAWVEGFLKPALGVEPTRLIARRDFHPGSTIPDEFERAVASSRYTVLVLSPAFLADPWAAFAEQLASFTGVEQGRARVVVLTLRGCRPPTRLRSLVGLDFTDPGRWDEEARRLRALLGGREPEPGLIACPYRGLMPFDEEDARFFTGREDEIQVARRHFRYQAFLLVIGPSGSGKSSLVGAGLLPAMKAPNSLFPKDHWLIRRMRPGSRPMEELARALGGDPSQPDRTLGELRAAHPPAGSVLLVVDPFEEVFTLVEDPAERARFIAALKGERAAEGGAVLIVLRADFFHDLMTSDLWPVDPAQRLEVAPLRAEALRRAIEQPAEELGVYLEPGLLDRLLADAANEPGVLPHVQETMVLLWDRMRHRRILLSDYERLGGADRSGLVAAMATRADASLAVLAAEQQTIARRIFRRLVQFGEGRADTRRPRPVRALRVASDDPALFDRTLEHLIRDRLLVPGAEPGPARMIDLAHEALIEGWPALKGWIAAYREAEQYRRRLEADAREWVRLGRGTGGLLDAVRLAEAERWAEGPDAAEVGSDPDIEELLRASRERLARERGEEQRRRRAMAELTSGLLLEQGVHLCEEGYVGRGLLLLAQSLSCAEGADASLQWAIRSNLSGWLPALSPVAATLPHPDRVLAFAWSPDGGAILTGCQDGRARLWEGSTMCRVLEHDGPVGAVAFRPDGPMLLTGSGDRTARLWNRATARPIGAALQHRDRVHAVAFHPDGRTVATGSGRDAGGPGQAHLWDLPTGQTVRLWDIPGAVRAIAFGPDGRHLATGGEDGMVRVWSTSSGALVAERELPGWVYGLAYSSDGRSLLIGTRDRTAWLWADANGPDPTPRALVHRGVVQVVAFDPDGTILTGSDIGGGEGEIQRWDRTGEGRLGSPRAIPGPVQALGLAHDGRRTLVAALDRTTRLWQVDHAEPSAEVFRPSVPVRAVAISPDGDFFLTGTGPPGSINTPGDALLWHRATATVVATFPHGGWINAVAFSPDGRTVLTSSCDRTVQLWDVGTSRPIGPALVHDHWAGPVCFSPDGQILATGSEDSHLRFWRTADSSPIGAPLAHPGPVYAVAFEPIEGRKVVTGCRDRAARFWDVHTGRQLGPTLWHASDIRSVAFSPDGSTVVTGSGDRTARLWDAETGRPLIGALRHDGPVWAVAFSPDGRTVLTGSGFGGKEGRGMARLWDARSGRPIGPPLPHGGLVGAVAFRRDGRVLLTGSEDGTARLWPVPVPMTDAVQWIARRIQVATGLELDPVGMTQVLDAPTWRSYRRQLENRDAAPPRAAVAKDPGDASGAESPPEAGLLDPPPAG
jgi:WD40 repeat protein